MTVTSGIPPTDQTPILSMYDIFLKTKLIYLMYWIWIKTADMYKIKIKIAAMYWIKIVGMY